MNHPTNVSNTHTQLPSGELPVRRSSRTGVKTKTIPSHFRSASAGYEAGGRYITKVTKHFRHNSDSAATLMESYKQINQARKNRGQFMMQASVTPSIVKVEESNLPSIDLNKVKIGGEGDCWKKLLVNYSPSEPQDCIDLFNAIIGDADAPIGESSPWGTYDPLTLEEIVNEYIKTTGQIRTLRSWTAEYINIWIVISDITSTTAHLDSVFTSAERPVDEPGKIKLNMAELTLHYHPNLKFKQIDGEPATKVAKVHKAITKFSNEFVAKEAELKRLKIGVTTEYLMRSKFFDKLEFNTDDANSKEYIQAVTDHDSRCINNAWARNKFNFVITTKPDKVVDTSAVRDVDSMLTVTNAAILGDANQRFLFDVALSYGYLNLEPKFTTIDREAMEMLNKQPFFEITEAIENHTLLTTNPDFDDVIKHNITVAVVPLLSKEPEGPLSSGLGYYKTDSNCSYVSWGTTTNVEVYGWITGLMQGDRSLSRNGHVVHVVSRKIFDAVQVMVLSPLTTNKTQIGEITTRKFEVPMLIPTSLWSLGIPIFKTVTCNLNLDLLNRLINKDLTGKVSPELLLEYGMALSWYSYNKRGVEISDHKIDPFDVKLHVYITKVLVRRESFLQNLESMAFEPGFNSVLISTAAAAIEHLTGKFSEDIEQKRSIIDSVINRLKVPNITNSFGEVLDNWASIDAWTMRNTVEVMEVVAPPKCHHHKYCPQPITGTECLHCFEPTALDNGYCKCCFNFTDCLHECISEHSTGELICGCCHKRIEEVCPCCRSKHIKNVEDTEPDRRTRNKTRARLERKRVESGHKEKPETQVPKPSYSAVTQTDTQTKSKTQSTNVDDVVQFSNAELVTMLAENAVLITRDEMSLEDVEVDPSSKLSIIPFVIQKHPVEKLSNFELIELVEPMGSLDCGINAVRHYVGLDYSSTLTRRVTNKDSNWSTHILCQVLNAYGLNAAIIEPSGVTFQRVDDTEEFACIIYETSFEVESNEQYLPDYQHWKVGKIKRKSMYRIEEWAYPQATMQEYASTSLKMYNKTYPELNEEQKLAVCMSLASHNVFKPTAAINQPKMENGRLFNSSVHNIENGLFNVSVPDQYQAIVSTTFDNLLSPDVPEELNKVWDDYENVLNIKENVESAIYNCLFTIKKTIADPIKYCRSKKLNVKKAGLDSYVDLEGSQIKNGDMLIINNKGVFEPIFVTVRNGRIKIEIEGKQIRIVTIYVPKQSFISTIMRLTSLFKANFDDTALEVLLSTSKVLYGYGGCGKTTEVGKWRKNNQEVNVAFIAWTTGGQASLREKLPFENVYSFEKYAREGGLHEMLIIDEASLVHAWELCLIAGPTVKSLWILGDLNQIAAVDMNISGGARLPQNLLARAIDKSSEIEYRPWTYRLGKDLVNELKKNPGMADIESRSKSNTTFTTEWFEDFEASKIYEIFKDCDVILCFYNEHVSRVSKVMLHSGIKKVTTVTKFQGLEKPNVGVLQMGLRNDADIHLDYNFGVSAATRASSHLVWVSVRCHTDKTPLSDRLGTKYSGLLLSQIDMRNPVGFLAFADENEPIKVIVDEIPELTWDELVTNVAKSVQPKHDVSIDDFSINKFSQLLKHFASFVKVELVSKTSDKLVLNFKAFGRKEKLTVNSNFDLTGAIPKQFTTQFEAMVKWSCNAKFSQDNPVFLSKKACHRLRILEFIIKVYKANNKEYKVECLPGHTFIVDDNSCAACGPLTILNKKKHEVFNVTKDYFTENARLCTGHLKEEIVEMFESDSCPLIPDEFDHEKLSVAILAERVATWQKDVPHVLKSGGKWMYWDETFNKLLAIEVKREIDLDIKITGPDPMRWYPFKKKTGLLSRSTSISYIKNDKRIVTKFNKPMSLMPFILESLLNMYETYVKEKTLSPIAVSLFNKYGALNDFGMVESIEWHKNRKTAAYYNLTSRMGKLKIKSLAYERTVLSLPKELFNACAHIDPTLNITSNTFGYLGEPYEAASDIILVRYLSNTHNIDDYQIRLNCIMSTYMNDIVQPVYPMIGVDPKSAEIVVQRSSFANILNNHMKHLADDHPLFKPIKQQLDEDNVFISDKVDKSKENLCTGPSIVSDVKILCKLATTYRKIIFWLPSNCFKVKDTSYLYIKDKSQHAYKVDPAVLEGIKNGFTVGDSATRFRIHLLKTLNHIGIFEISNGNGNLWATPHEKTSGFIKLTLPKLVIDPSKIIDSGQLIQEDVSTFDIDVLNNLRRRMLRPGTTEDDLKVQARTLLNTAQFSTNSIFQKYNMTVAAMMKHMKVAYAISKFEDIMLGFLKGNSWTDDLETAGISIIADFMRIIVPDLPFKNLISSIPAEYQNVLFKTMLAITNQLDKIRPITIGQTKSFVTELNYNRLGLTGSLIKLFRNSNYVKITAPTHLYRIHGCKECESAVKYLERCGLRVPIVNSQVTRDLVLKTSKCTHTSQFEYTFNTKLMGLHTPVHPEFEDGQLIPILDPKTLTTDKDINVPELNAPIEWALILNSSVTVTIGKRLPVVYVPMKNNNVVIYNNKPIHKSFPIPKNPIETMIEYNRRILNLTNESAIHLPGQNVTDQRLRSVLPSEMIDLNVYSKLEYTRNVFGTDFDNLGMIVGSDLRIAPCYWAELHLKKNAHFQWCGVDENGNYIPGQLYNINDLESPYLRPIYSDWIDKDDYSVVEPSTFGAPGDRVVAMKAGETYTRGVSDTEMIVRRVGLIRQGDVMETNNSYYYCSDCNTIYCYPTFVHTYLCENGHNTILVGHPKGLSDTLPPWVTFRKYPKDLVELTESEDVIETLENVTNDYEHNAFTPRSFDSVLKSLQTKELLGWKEKLDLSDGNKTTLGSAVWTLLTKKERNHICDIPGYLSLDAYSWIAATHKRHWLQGSTNNYDYANDFLPIKTSALWLNGIRGQEWWLNNDGVLYISDPGGLDQFFTQMICLSQIYHNEWIIQNCPAGFTLCDVKWLDYSCCTKIQWVNENNKHVNEDIYTDLIDNLNDTKYQEGIASMTMLSPGSWALEIARSEDGLMSYGLACNSWNFSRPYIGNVNHGNKFNDSPLEIDTVIPLPTATRFPEHFSSWQGTYDNNTRLCTNLYTKNDVRGSLILPAHSEGLPPKGVLKEELDANDANQHGVGWLTGYKNKCLHPNNNLKRTRQYKVCGPKTCVADLIGANKLGLHSSIVKPEQFNKVTDMVIPKTSTVDVVAILSVRDVSTLVNDRQWYHRYMGLPIDYQSTSSQKNESDEEYNSDVESDEESDSGSDDEEDRESYHTVDEENEPSENQSGNDQIEEKDGDQYSDSDNETIKADRDDETLDDYNPDELKSLDETIDGSYSENARHFVECIGTEEHKDDVDLPDWYIEQNFTLSDTEYEIFINPVMPKRLAKGRDLLSANTHGTSKVFSKGVKVSGLVYKALKKLYNIILRLKIKHSDIVHIYAMHEGIAERSLSINKGRHICFTTNEAKYKSRGFETIKLLKEPGRLGACLRPIFGMLCPEAKAIVTHGGRVNTHGIWIERCMEWVLDNKECKSNFAVSAWSTMTPYMDGFCFIPGCARSAKYINSNILYSTIYGIDEAEIKELNLSKTYINATTTAKYSNIGIHPILKAMDEQHQKEKLPEHLYKLNDLPMVFVNKSLVSASNVKLAWHHDGNVFTKETRGYTMEKDPEFEAWFENFIQGDKEVNLGLNLLQNKNVEYVAKVDGDVRVLMNPEVTESCVEHCVRRFLFTEISEADPDDIIGQGWFKSFMNLDEIKSSLFTIGLNYEIIEGDTVYGCLFNEGPKLQIRLSKNQYGRGHAVLCEFKIKNFEEWSTPKKSVYKEKRDEILAKEGAWIDLDAYLSGISDRYDGIYDFNDVKNAKARIRGRLDIMSRRKQRTIMCVGQQLSNCEALQIQGVGPGALLCFRSSNGLKFSVSEKLKDNSIIVRVRDVYSRFCIDTGARLKLKDAKPEVKKLILAEQREYAFMSYSDKAWAMNSMKTLASIPVDSKAKVVYLRNFDNRAHHNFDLREDFYNRDPNTIRVMGRVGFKLSISNESWALFREIGDVKLVIEDGYVMIAGNGCYTEDKDLKLMQFGMREQEKIEKFSEMDENSINIHQIIGTLGLMNPENKDGDGWRSECEGSQLNLWSRGFNMGYEYPEDKKFEVTLIPLKYQNKNFEHLVNLNSQYKLCNWKQGLGVLINLVGAGYMEYAMKNVKSVKVHENILDSHNTIDDLAANTIASKTDQTSLEVKQAVYSVTSLNNLVINDDSDRYTLMKTETGLTENRQATVLYGTGTMTDPINGEVYRVPVPADTMNYWDDETAMIGGTMKLPNTDIKLQNREEFDGVKQVEKAIMVQYPSHSQPAYTKRMTAGLQAVSDLFGGKIALRQVEHDPLQDADLFEHTYFKPGAKAALPSIGLNPEAILDWLKERPDKDKICEDLMDLLTSGLDIRGLDKVNVHMKLESRMKDVAMHMDRILNGQPLDSNNGMPETIDEQRIRLIVWQRKGIAAIFSPFFKEVKDALKKVLIDNVVYVDGMTPQQISARLNQVDGDVTFAEDDLKKQDRQTDSTLIDTEMEIYKKLGANPSIVNLWRNVHNHWRAKGVGLKFVGDASRHTGQATTALGNAIVNLMVKRRLVAELGNNLQLMMVLGDDNIILTKGAITEQQISLNSARHFNMQSEPYVGRICGGFLRMIIFKNNVGSLSAGPDVIRLRRRFEVTNGVSEATEENLISRSMSYCVMLGDLPPVRRIVEKEGWPVELSKWYDWHALSTCLASKYRCSQEQVETELANLIEMIEKREFRTNTKLMLTSKGN
uniref:Polyprotein n=1 Tax=Rhizoctonia solani endornavirus 7 TaxID=2599613 RepID=A0A5B8GX07_9VIRU|nr:polyprotein [Rhizoctonia solani endornavirus 7]